VKRREERDSKCDYYNVLVNVSRDFHNEDDEGYEGKTFGDGCRNSLISPQLVGGRRSFSKSSSS